MATVAGATALVHYGLTRVLRHVAKATGVITLAAIFVVSIAAALFVAMLGARLLSQGNAQVQLSLSAAAVPAALGCVVWTLHSPFIRAARSTGTSGQSPAVSRMVLLLNLALAWGLVGAAIRLTFGVWQAGAGLRDPIGTLCFGGPIVIAISAVVLAYRRKVTALIGGPRPRTALRGVIARHWPVVLPAAMLLIYLSGQLAFTLGSPLPTLTLISASVSLRHHRGPLATIPYDSVGRVLNFSRDYAIEKTSFRVALNTDLEKLRKIFKKIGEELAEDPELKDDLLQPFKSQGIENVEDGTLVVRGTFMAKAGRQHNIRKKVLLAVHKAFLENDIRAVAKPY
jgi:hypothetical protein